MCFGRQLQGLPSLRIVQSKQKIRTFQTLGIHYHNPRERCLSQRKIYEIGKTKRFESGSFVERTTEQYQADAAGTRIALTKSGVPVKPPRDMSQCKICKVQIVSTQTVALKSHAESKHAKNTYADCFDA